MIFFKISNSKLLINYESQAGIVSEVKIIKRRGTVMFTLFITKVDAGL